MSGRGGEPVAAGDRDDDPLHVAAIARAFRVLEALSAADRPMTLTQLVRFRNEGWPQLRDDAGFPGSAPPWGTLTAIDLSSGQHVWRIPFGEYPALAARGQKDTGSENYGGPVVTAGGVVFIGATVLDRKFRAFDKTTGKLLWETLLPAAGLGTPAVYEANGRQFVVTPAGGPRNAGEARGASYVAFALPAAR